MLCSTATGLVCPHGHGKILPLQIDRLSPPHPIAAKIGKSRQSRTYRLSHTPPIRGLWRTVSTRPSKRSFQARRNARLPAEFEPAESWQVALYRGRLMWFAPVHKRERRRKRNAAQPPVTAEPRGDEQDSWPARPCDGQLCK